MKKGVCLLFVVVFFFSLIGVGFSFTSGTAWNSQTQKQSSNFQDYGVNGGYSIMGGNQAGLGGSVASFGSSSSEGQMQFQGYNLTYSNANTKHEYHTYFETHGGSIAHGPGIAGHIEGTSASFKTVTVGANGMFGVGGSQENVKQSAGVASSFGSKATAGTEAHYGNNYEYFNNGATSYTHHAGVSRLDAKINVKAKGGIAVVDYEAKQVGGTVAINNGVATGMVGGSRSVGSVDTNGGFLGNASSHAKVNQAQAHMYEQGASSGGAYQYQTGFTATHNMEVR